MENRTPDILVELSGIETKDGLPWEPEPFGRYSAVLSADAKRIEAHLMLESNLFSGMSAKVPVKFYDIREAETLFGEGVEFTVLDRGCRCKGKVVNVLPRPGEAEHLSDSAIDAEIPPPIHTDREALPAAKEDWAPPRELALSTPRQCGPTSTYFGLQLYLIFSGVIVLAVMALVIGKPFSHLRALKTLQESGVRVDGMVNDYTAIADRATSRSSTPAHFVIDYTYQIPKNVEGETTWGLYQGRDRLAQRTRSGEQLARGKTIPVVYDRSDPRRSMLVDDLDLGDYPYIRQIGISAIVICTVCPALFAWLVHFIYLRQRRLLTWGRVARATLIDKKLVRGNQNYWIATYAFRDNHGVLVKFSQYKRKDKIGGLCDLQTVLFDPSDSAKALAYPLKMVALQTSSS